MKEGKLVPMDVTIGLLKEAMIKSGGSVFLIDGFPRSLNNYEVNPCLQEARFAVAIQRLCAWPAI